MKIPGKFHHIAVSVVNLDESIRFYTCVLDFKIVWEKEGANIDEIVGLPGVYMAMLTGYETHLELFEYVEPRGNQLRNNRQCDFGLIHICLMVDDVRQSYEYLKSKGLKFNTEPASSRPGSTTCSCAGWSHPGTSSLGLI